MFQKSRNTAALSVVARFRYGNESVLSGISANGHGAEIRELLKKYVQTKLSGIDPKDYPALLADAEVLK